MTLQMRDQENIKIGKEIGEKNRSVSVAKKLFAKGMLFDDVRECVEDVLTDEELREIEKEVKGVPA